MNRMTLALLFSIAVSASALAGFQHTIDFEAVPFAGFTDYFASAGEVNASYSDYGVTFGDSWEAVREYSGSADAYSGDVFVYLMNSSDYLITFDSAVDQVGAWFSLGSGCELTLEAYDVNGDIVASDGLYSESGTDGYISLNLTASGIRSFGISGNIDRIVMDDLRFGSSAVPAPSSLLLACIGLLTFGAAKRLRRRR